MNIKINKKSYSKKTLKEHKAKALYSYFGEQYIKNRKRAIEWTVYDLIDHGYEDCYRYYCSEKKIKC